MRDEDKKGTSLKNKDRRRALKKILVGAGVATSTFILPLAWEKPLISMGTLPAHAATSPDCSAAPSGTAYLYANCGPYPSSCGGGSWPLICGVELTPSPEFGASWLFRVMLTGWPANCSINYGLTGCGAYVTNPTQTDGALQVLEFQVTSIPPTGSVTITISNDCGDCVLSFSFSAFIIP